MYSNVVGKIGAVVTALALALSAFAMLAPMSAQAAGCNFTRDLYVGVTGDDVRCLQVYLNTAGNARIAASGVGSPGNETTIFGSLTGQAVLRWQQANGIAGANGVFGKGSRAKYTILLGSSDSTPTTPTVPVGGAQDQIRARIAILEAVAAYQDAVDEGGEESLLEDSIDSLLNAMVYYVNNSYTQAISAANNATNDAEDAMGDNSDDDNGSGDYDDDQDGAHEAINDARDAVDEAEEAIDDSDADDDDLEEAGNLFADAEEALEEAEDAYSDDDWDETIDAALDAIDLAEEATDLAGGSNDENEAEDMLDEAWSDFDSAWEDVNEAEDDGDDTDDAEDLLDEAEEVLNDADDAFDDEDWEEVIDLVDDANELIEDALNEI